MTWSYTENLQNRANEVNKENKERIDFLKNKYENPKSNSFLYKKYPSIIDKYTKLLPSLDNEEKNKGNQILKDLEKLEREAEESWTEADIRIISDFMKQLENIVNNYEESTWDVQQITKREISKAKNDNVSSNKKDLVDNWTNEWERSWKLPDFSQYIKEPETSGLTTAPGAPESEVTTLVQSSEVVQANTEIDKNIRGKVNEYKAIKLDFELDYNSWEDFRSWFEKKLDENLERSWLEEKEKLKEREEVLSFVDKDIKPIIETVLNQSNKLKLSRIRDALDWLLDQALTNPLNSDWSITITPSKSVWQIFDDLFSSIAPSALDYVPSFEFWKEKMTFSSREEAVEVLWQFKKWLSELKWFWNWLTWQIEWALESTLLGVIVYAWKEIWSLAWEFEKKYISMLWEYIQFCLSNLALWSLITWTAIISLNKIYQRSTTWLDASVFKRLEDSFENIHKLYKDSGLEAYNIEKVKNNIYQIHPETSSWMLDNEKKTSQVYQELQSWKWNTVMDFFRSTTSYVWDIVDGWRKPLSWEKWKGLLTNIRYMWFDLLILPQKLMFMFVNKWPKWWRIKNKWAIIQDFIKYNENAFKKFDDIFKTLDRIQGKSNWEITIDDITKLKGEILSEYRSNVWLSKLNPLMETKFERAGRFKIKRVNIDSLTYQKVSDFINEKFGNTWNYDTLIRDFLQELKKDGVTFDRIYQSIESSKWIIDDFIKYSPEVDPLTEKQLLEISDLVSSFSKDKDAYIDNLVNEIKNFEQNGKKIFDPAISNIDFTLIEERARKSIYSFEWWKVDIKNFKASEMDTLINYLKTKEPDINIVKDFVQWLKNNWTFWWPHLISLIEEFPSNKDTNKSYSYDDCENIAKQNYSFMDYLNKVAWHNNSTSSSHWWWSNPKNPGTPWNNTNTPPNNPGTPNTPPNNPGINESPEDIANKNIQTLMQKKLEIIDLQEKYNNSQDKDLFLKKNRDELVKLWVINGDFQSSRENISSEIYSEKYKISLDLIHRVELELRISWKYKNNMSELIKYKKSINTSSYISNLDINNFKNELELKFGKIRTHDEIFENIRLKNKHLPYVVETKEMFKNSLGDFKWWSSILSHIHKWTIKLH